MFFLKRLQTGGESMTAVAQTHKARVGAIFGGSFDTERRVFVSHFEYAKEPVPTQRERRNKSKSQQQKTTLYLS